MCGVGHSMPDHASCRPARRESNGELYHRYRAAVNPNTRIPHTGATPSRRGGDVDTEARECRIGVGISDRGSPPPLSYRWRPPAAASTPRGRCLKGGQVSKLVDKLSQTSRGSSQPLGFRGAASAAPGRSPTLVLIAELTDADPGTLADEERGAHAILLSTPDSEAVTSLGDVPWGAPLTAAGDKELGDLKNRGCDFVLFDPHSAPPALLREEDVGKVVQVDPSMADGLLRVIARLAVDAVLVSGDDQLSLHRLMVCQHVAGMVHKPLIAAVPLDATTEALEELRDAGVNAVLVRPHARDKQALSRLREVVDSLPPARKKKQQKVDAVLPSLRREPDLNADEEEEEEDSVEKGRSIPGR